MPDVNLKLIMENQTQNSGSKMAVNQGAKTKHSSTLYLLDLRFFVSLFGDGFFDSKKTDITWQVLRA